MGFKKNIIGVNTNATVLIIGGICATGSDDPGASATANRLIFKTKLRVYWKGVRYNSDWETVEHYSV